jgi:hypothetical protein
MEPGSKIVRGAAATPRIAAIDRQAWRKHVLCRILKTGVGMEAPDKPFIYPAPNGARGASAAAGSSAIAAPKAAAPAFVQQKRTK